jgi:hypothetical protein
VGACGFAQIRCQRRIVDRARQNHAADAERYQRQSLLPRGRLADRQVGFECSSHLLEHMTLGDLDGLGSPGRVRGQADHRAAGVPIIEMIPRKISIDDHLR